MFARLAEELLAKESINLPQIIKVLGDRPFPMKESLREYLVELETRSKQEAERDSQEKAEREKEASEAAEQAHTDEAAKPEDKTDEKKEN